jgi:AraC-like DNA-binding protein
MTSKMVKQKAGDRAAEAMLRVGATMGVPEVLLRLGYSPLEVLSEAGFDAWLFDDPANMISYDARGRLMAHCAAKTNCEHFGLLVGQCAGLGSLGLVGLLMKYSPDVRTALNNLVRYFHLYVHGAAISLDIEGDAVILGYQILQGGTGANNQVGDGAVSGLASMVRELCGHGWKPMEVWFMHRRPKDIEPFRRLFRVPVRFDAEQYAVVFRSSWLQRPLPEIDAGVRQLLQKQIDSLAARHGDNFPEQVRTVLRAAVLSGHSRADQVAALFSTHPRTLNRRLRAYGIGYQELVDERRFELARQMLKDSDLDIRQIAEMLHYAEARSFIRAFRRWSGETPARWRAARKQVHNAVGR